MSVEYGLVMAAGKGSRMRPLTKILPKAMAPYREATLISNNVNLLREACEYVGATVGYMREKLASYCMEIDADFVLNVLENDNAWWIYNTFFRHVHAPVLLITCDNLIDIDLKALLNDYASQGSPDLMVVPTPVSGDAEGDFLRLDSGNHVLELNREINTGLFCSGLQILNPGKIAASTESVDNFTQVWSQLMEAGVMKASNVRPSSWCAVDTLEQLARVQDL